MKGSAKVGINVYVEPPTVLSERRLFQNRIAKRTFIHGRNWRQVFINYGGMCYRGYAVEGLEFHEPFGEDKYNWSMLQARILLCHDCHMNGIHQDMFNQDSYLRPSRLSEDVSVEMLIHGGYDQWVKDFKLENTFARW